MKKNIYLIDIKEHAGYDCYDAHVVIANTEKEARTLCDFADEGRDTWLDSKYSTIEKIGETNKKSQCILSSFNAG